jgi:hypothetical protein
MRVMIQGRSGNKYGRSIPDQKYGYIQQGSVHEQTDCVDNNLITSHAAWVVQQTLKIGKEGATCDFVQEFRVAASALSQTPTYQYLLGHRIRNEMAKHLHHGRAGMTVIWLMDDMP